LEQVSLIAEDLTFALPREVRRPGWIAPAGQVRSVAPQPTVP
jgi:hypothetical protein